MFQWAKWLQEDVRVVCIIRGCEGNWIFSETLQLQETIELCTKGGAGWVHLSGWDVKNSQDGESWKLEVPAAPSPPMLCLHICKYKICSVLWLEKRVWELSQGNCLSPTRAPEGSTENWSLNADPSALGNGLACWPVVWGNFAAFQGFWFIVESLQKPLWLPDYWCLLLFHVQGMWPGQHQIWYIQLWRSGEEEQESIWPSGNLSPSGQL